MEDKNFDDWSQRVFALVQEMEDAELDASTLITLTSFFAVSAAHKTQKPLFALETLIGILMGAAEDERRTRPEQAQLGLV